MSSFFAEPFGICSKVLVFNLKARNSLVERGKTEEKGSGEAGKGLSFLAGFYTVLNKSLIVTESFGCRCSTSDNNMH